MISRSCLSQGSVSDAHATGHEGRPGPGAAFGFVPESHFERAAPLLLSAAAVETPLDGVRTFRHRAYSTV
ncbi:hypothetical protein [Streptomyces sp. NPDC057582]|uniref:hypothetical protein n=1 Tax=unclassified Streptomyces TaxID=2593676 RepID=UPI0036A2EB03